MQEPVFILARGRLMARLMIFSPHRAREGASGLQRPKNRKSIWPIEARALASYNLVSRSHLKPANEGQGA